MATNWGHQPPRPPGPPQGPAAPGTALKAVPLRAAVPDYLWKRLWNDDQQLRAGNGGAVLPPFLDAAPGLRFRTLLRAYRPGTWDIGKKTVIEEKRKQGQTFLKTEDKDDKLTPLQEVCSLSAGVQELEKAVAARLAALAGPGDLLLTATSTAPLVTGTGMEHPLENGFAFLDPYGLPYLPGSSIKGALRRAAEELALFEADNGGWTILDVFWLFGFDLESGFFQNVSPKRPDRAEEERREWKEAWLSAVRSLEPGAAQAFLRAGIRDDADQRRALENPIQSLEGLHERSDLGRAIHFRGALQFWDSVPVVAGGKLRVDILNPHYSDYYQGSLPPGDWMNPKPIFFLTIPPGSRFTFAVRFAPPNGTPEGCRERWQGLVRSAFDLTAEWLGFGAKTSVGYGRFDRDREAEQRREQQRLEQTEKARAEDLARREAEKELQRERQRQEEAERERVRLERLGPAGQVADELRKSGTTLARVQEIQNSELAKFSGADQRVVAQALMEAYQRHGSWSGKLSDKQKQKVQKIQEILGT